MTSECAHCGLPLGRRPATATIDGVREEFCCYGCALARQITRARGESGAAATVLIRLGLAIFFAMNAMMVTLPTYVSSVYGTDAVAHDGPLFQALRVLGTIFTLPVLALLGVPIVATAGRSLRSGVPNTDALIVLGAAAAWALSVANVAAGKPDVYFDTVVMLLILVTLGRYLEARARADAGEAVSHSLSGAVVEATRLASLDDGIGASVALDDLQVGDLVRVTPGESFPGDAVVVRGAGGADQSVLTGEHRPVLLAPGSEVPGGTSSLDGVFTAQLIARPADSTVARIERMLAEARRQRTPAQRLADRASNVMMPLVLLAALGAGLYWGIQQSAAQGLLVGLAVLCVACPCGLGIATPVAVWTALRRAARAGVVACNPAALEGMARLRQVFFDKTGTLTERVPRVCEVHVEPGCEWSTAELLAAAAAVERGLHHPVARAIVAAAQAQTATIPVAGEVAVVPGRGVSADVGGRRLTVGSLAFAARQLATSPQPLWSDGETSEIAVWESGRLLGRIGLRETARADAAGAVAALRRLGLDLKLLTGDAQAGAVVPGLIASADAALGLLPEDKMRRLEQARERAGVAMVGDGINDGPALACADVGIAVCSATDLARTTADVVLMTDDLAALPWLFSYSRRVTRVIHQNLVWVFAYNAVAVAAAATGRLTPLLASLAMIGSSLIVVANSRRLGGSAGRRKDPRPAATVAIDLAASRPLAG